MLARFVAVSLLTLIAFSITTFSDSAFALRRGTDQQNVYWTLFANSSFPQVQIATVPLAKKSKVSTVKSTEQNNLVETSGEAFDSEGRFWILSFGQTNGVPTSALAFNLPITAHSAPVITLVLNGTVSADGLAFDPSGNLWVSSPGNESVVEYTGPFTESGEPAPARVLTAGLNNPFAIAVDKKGNVYASNNASTGTHSITVFKSPYTAQPYFLNGLSGPGGLIFDSAGNLYSESTGTPSSLVRYNSNDLKSGDSPSIVDSAGLRDTSYLAAFAFAANGDLYAANCGNDNTAGIQVWPLSTKSFSPHLKPSVNYTNKKILQDGCAWGIAIH